MLQFDEYRVKLNNLKPELDKLGEALDLDSAARELDELHAQSAADGFWDNVEKARKVQKRISNLEDKVNAKTLEVDLQLPEEPVPVWGDQDAITQVCYNLLDNAIKFSQEGGVLGLGVSVKGAKATVTISNQGETIPPGEQQLIFDRFHKTDHSRSADRDGVGLGLYIVKTILNSHKETISCVSEDGVTKFIFTMTRA